METKLKYNYAFNNAEVVFREMFTYLTCKQHDIQKWRASLLTAPCTIAASCTGVLISS